jgi:HK97 gp10 family phage protein
MTQGIKIEGIPGVRRTLKELGPVIEKRVVADATRNVARKTASEIKKAAPRSSASDRSPASIKYGHLRTNIKAQKKRATLYFVNVGRSFWGRFLEFGTSRMPARPWFRPKWDAIKGQMEAGYVTEIDRQIQRQAEKLAAKNARLK